MKIAFDAAFFTDAARIFDVNRTHANGEACLLRARLYLKTDVPVALEYLSSPVVQALTVNMIHERMLLLAIGHSRVRDFAVSDSYFEKAAGRSARRGFFSSKRAYWRARRYLIEGRVDSAQELIPMVRRANDLDTHVLALHLQSAIFGHRERFREQAGSLLETLHLIESSRTAHAEIWIWAMHTLSVLSREIDNEEVKQYVKAHVRDRVWPPDFAVNEFQALKAVGWAHALEGDYFNAFRFLKLAGEVAPTRAWRAMAHLDRAYLARCIGEPRWSRQELAEADELVQPVQWGDTSDEERIALILLAELFASLDSGRATYYMARFQEIRDGFSPLLHFQYDRRLMALANFASGIVQFESGNRRTAILALQKSWQTFSEIQYDWRAGRSALRLFEITGDNRWLLKAEEKLKRYSASWLQADLAKIRQIRPSMPKLTVAQEVVFKHICQGRSTEGIARLLGRSQFTIRNHVKAILRAFNVETRVALVAEARRRLLV